jgi:hypothetical protein
MEKGGAPTERNETTARKVDGDGDRQDEAKRLRRTSFARNERLLVVMEQVSQVNT